MIKISENVTMEGFDTREELDEWIREQEKIEPNESVLKTFKWFLMKVEKADKNKKASIRDCEALEKYANKVIERNLMSKDNVIKYIVQALEI